MTVVEHGARLAMPPTDSGVLSCPLCGATLLIDPDGEFDPVERHAAWHARQHEQELRSFREPSKPAYQLGDVVRVSTLDRQGKIVDMWDEPGPIHMYTIRLDGCELSDIKEANLELVVRKG